MCIVKTPKIQNTGTTSSDKPLPVLQNPILDGLNPSIQSLRIGRSALRIDPVAPGSPVPVISGTNPALTAPAYTPTPSVSIGGSTGVGGSGGGAEPRNRNVQLV